MIETAVGIGFGVGLIVGALGGGGSVLTVPALVYLLGELPHRAGTASLVIVGISSVIGLLVRSKSASHSVSHTFLARAFAVLLVLVAVYTATTSAVALG